MLDEPTVEEAIALMIAGVTRGWASVAAPRPTEPTLDDEVRRRLDDDMPVESEALAKGVADALAVLDASISPARPRYAAYVGSTGLRVGVLAQALTATYDVNLAAAAGPAEELEAQAVRWMGEFCGFGASAGAFTSGGMTSNLSALLAARERAMPGSREHGLRGRGGAVYCSEEAHSSIERAVEAIGLGRCGLRRVPIDAERRMDPDALDALLRADRRTGIAPVAVVATAGSTLTGAVDPLDALADCCDAHGAVWLHVDGAYGGLAARAASVSHLFQGLSRADSVALDAHKWLGLQKSCSLVLLRERRHLQAAFAHNASYMSDGSDAPVKPVDLTFEYSRPLRALKPWLALRAHGATALLDAIDATIALAREFHRQIIDRPQLQALHSPQLSTVCFRHVPDAAAGQEAAITAHNAALAAAVQRDGRVYLASAVLDGRVCLRVSFVHFRATTADIGIILDAVEELGVQLLR